MEKGRASRGQVWVHERGRERAEQGRLEGKADDETEIRIGQCMGQESQHMQNRLADGWAKDMVGGRIWP